MGEEPEIGIVDRVRGFFSRKPITPSAQTDQYITEKLPEFIREYKLADRTDLMGVEKKLEQFDREISDLKKWKKDTKGRYEEVKKRVNRLEKKYGVEG